MNWRDPIGRGKSGGGEKCTMGWERDSHVVESLLVEWKLYGPTFGGCLLSLHRLKERRQPPNVGPYNFHSTSSDSTT
jgi:hypothetical protein